MYNPVERDAHTSLELCDTISSHNFGLTTKCR